MPRAQSVPPASNDRNTERRLIPSTPQTPGEGESTMAAESKRELAQEDFLYHLYRGSELLQENRVLEAKEELELALTVQPTDAKGQDLLGAVYFRLGLYPRAIQIYEALESTFPKDGSIKINLALCYLKTGQPERARRVLEDAVRISPDHKRAWGYLGLALQKLGELEQAQIAFERGGHAMMARRVTEKKQRAVATPSVPPAEIDEGVRSVAETAFSELDAGELRFALAEPAPPRPSDGRWVAVEIGAHARPTTPPSRPQSGTPVAPASAPPEDVSTRLLPPKLPQEVHEPPPEAGLRHAPPLLSALPAGESFVLHPNGVLLARATAEQGLAARLDALRIVAGTVESRVMHRRAREVDTHEVLGGIGSPIVRIGGDASLVVGARRAHRIATLGVGDEELAFVREDALLAFELRLAYENGRLAVDPPDEQGRSPEGIHVTQLRGRGALALELRGELASVGCTPGRPVTVRREWIVGWLGRLVPRAVPSSESPGGQRGLVAFSGHGSVLVCPE